MSQYLLDTDACIYIINERPSRAKEKFKQLRMENIFISSITSYELFYGAAKSERMEKTTAAVASFLAFTNLLSFDMDDSRAAGVLRAELESKGTLIGPYDLQIAGQALAKNKILVTNNLTEFKRVKNLKLENWIK